MINLTTIIVGCIGIVALFGIIGHIQISYLLKKWVNEIKSMSEDSQHASPSRWIQLTISDYKRFHLAGTTVNTQAIIERHLFNEPILLAGVIKIPIGNCTKLVQYLPSFTIILGIMGTFLGLTKSMFSMQDTLLNLGSSGAATVTANNIVSSIAAPFQGMSLAFITSIAGIGTALILNIFQAGFLSKGQSVQFLLGKVFTECESYLDHQVHSELITEKPQDSLEKLLDRLVSRVSESFQNTIGDFASTMGHFTEKLGIAMDEVNKILVSQREYSDVFASSTESLQIFGERFSKATTTFDEAHTGISARIKQLEECVNRAFQQQEQGQKQIEQFTEQNQQKLEKVTQQSQSILEQSHKKSEDLSRNFLRALDQQMQAYQEKYDTASGTLTRQQDDWLYRHQDVQSQYAQASDAFATSVTQLEKSLYNTFEKVKREVLDQIKYQNDRQSSMMQSDASRQDPRELIRAIESVSHQMDHSMRDNQRYLQEFYQLLQRMSVIMEQQNPPKRMSQSQLSSRVIE